MHTLFYSYKPSGQPKYQRVEIKVASLAAARATLTAGSAGYLDWKRLKEGKGRLAQFLDVDGSVDRHRQWNCIACGDRIEKHERTVNPRRAGMAALHARCPEKTRAQRDAEISAEVRKRLSGLLSC